MAADKDAQKYTKTPGGKHQNKNGHHQGNHHSPEGQPVSRSPSGQHRRPLSHNHHHYPNHHQQQQQRLRHNPYVLNEYVNGRGGGGGVSYDKHNLRQHLNIHGVYESRSNAVALHHRPVVKPSKQDSTLDDTPSELTTSFDPMKDRHMWTMWRTAVNGRIVDEVRRLERIKNQLGSDRNGPSGSPANGITAGGIGGGGGRAPGMYGKALVTPPLRRFIRLDVESRDIAQNLMNAGEGGLHPSQFVYYGLPRVYVPARR